MEADIDADIYLFYTYRQTHIIYGKTGMLSLSPYSSVLFKKDTYRGRQRGKDKDRRTWIDR